MHINVPSTLILCTDQDTKGNDLQRADRFSWGIILGTKGMNQVNHTYPKPEIRPKLCQNFLFPSHLEELATFRTH